MGRRKKKTEPKVIDDVLDPDPLLDLYIKKRWQPPTDLSSYSTTCKIWNTAWRRCSQNHQYPSLLVPYHHKQNTKVVSKQWSHYLWRLHYFPRQRPGCCPEGAEICKVGNLNWMQEERNLEDPNAQHGPRDIEFTNSIGLKGKFYALSLQGTLASIDTEDAYPRLTVSNVGRAVPSARSKGFREHLVEFAGDLLLLFQIYKKSMDTVDDIEVYKLDLLGSTWKKMNSLGDHALFVTKHRCMDIFPRELGHRRQLISITDASESDEWWSKAGCRRNCIYFTQGTNDHWSEFHMEDGSILPNESLIAALPKNGNNCGTQNKTR